MNTLQDPVGPRWRMSFAGWVLVGGASLMLLAAFSRGLRDLVHIWDTQEEYSFGYIIPFVTLYLLWQKRDALQEIRFSGAWSGTALVSIALLLLAVGQLATLGTVVQYAFLMSVFGLTLAFSGWPAFRVMAMPLAILIFMVPLPNYFLRELSAALQLWSSELGAAIIRAFGISVFLEGNVIDLGVLKLQVVEACSGLRYLIPLMTLGFIAVTLFRAPLWKRAVVFFSTIPITLLMNSVRIGVIGILVEHFGKSMAEGFLHDFEGWAVFMLCTGILVAEILLLAKLGDARATLGSAFAIEPSRPATGGNVQERRPSAQFLVAAGLVVVAAVVAQLAPAPVHEVPGRRTFAEFPSSLGRWNGTMQRLEPEYLQLLKLDDYILAEFSDGKSLPINLYVSYYASQANGNSAHSPRACIPGDGWEISDFRTQDLGRVDYKGLRMRVNRVVIGKGENRQLVYYWFQQRGRVETDEYVVKLNIFRDAVTRRRSDGAMVRLVARLRPGEPEQLADNLLEQFSHALVPALEGYVPD